MSANTSGAAAAVARATSHPRNVDSLTCAALTIARHYNGLSLINGAHLTERLTDDFTTLDPETLIDAAAGLLCARAALAFRNHTSLTDAATAADTAGRHHAADAYRATAGTYPPPDTALPRLIAEMACDLADARRTTVWPGLATLVAAGAATLTLT